MPNWVYNTVTIYGQHENIKKVKAQLNRSFIANHEELTQNGLEKTYQNYTNPVFSFRNIIKPDDSILEEYYGKNRVIEFHDHSKSVMENVAIAMTNAVTSNHWYDWNNRNWGTKWDVAVVDGGEHTSGTNIVNESPGSITYTFRTAWSPIPQLLTKLSEQNPKLKIYYHYVEEQGWGGEVWIEDGKEEVTSEWEWKCEECEAYFEKTPRLSKVMQETDTCPKCVDNVQI